MVILPRVVPTCPHRIDLFGPQAENEYVLLADLSGHFNGRAVHGTYRQGAVQREFHIPGSRCFGPGG